MQKALLFMILLGTGIGLIWPTGEPATPIAVPEQAQAVAPEAAPAPGQAQAFTSPAPRETVLESIGGHFYADVEVNDQPVRFLVDTGATTVALSEKDAARIGIPFSSSEFTVVGRGASGPVRGKSLTLRKVTLDGKEARDVRGAIIEGGETSLLGQAYLREFTVEMRGDTMRIH